MTLKQYITSINQRYQLGNATEHTYRGDLQLLIENLMPNIRATNEPKRQSCGAPDYILTLKDIPVGYIEAKDIGDNDLDGLKKTGNKEQFDRYKSSLNNIIFTDYINFHLYRDGELVDKVAIAELAPNSKGTGLMIRPLNDNFDRFESFIKDFCNFSGTTIKNSKKLAEMMAAKARLLSEVIEKSLTSDDSNDDDSTLKEQKTAFKEVLIHDITPKGFADVYAQTITYGMFAARLHDPDLDTFSRQEAAELIPKSNPFLRKLFQYIAGYDLDDRIKWIVDDLVQIFLSCNVGDMMNQYGKSTQMEDPIIHFYEDFLSEYDPKLRKARGVWYTPQPVVNFIVRAVDEIVSSEFDLPQGLADTSKVKIKVDVQSKKKAEREVHKVQILDPATGTGTFLAETLKHIHKKFESQKGIWNNYVEEHLIPRLNGFELLMASYAMAHLKLDMLLRETGFSPTKDQRLRIYLTNSLEEHHPDTGTLFANWLSTEANEANFIKRDTPVMVVMGNPPYSGESANKGKWIMDLMDDYKYEPGGKERLKERNPKWINDDYVKFIRFGSHLIEKNGEGVLAFINPHGFLDNPTFRGMRWHLMNTFDKIYTIDLHGNAKKKETTPDGSIDENVFDIMQGVSINLFIKKNKANTSRTKAQILHYDLYGKRNDKYSFLNNNSLLTINWQELNPKEPELFFVPKDFEAKKEYDKGFSIVDLFPVNNVGIVTSRDAFIIDDKKESLVKRMNDFFDLPKEDIQKKYNLKENKSWKIEEVKSKAVKLIPDAINKITYRPFDNRYVYYDDSFIERSRKDIMRHFKNNNISIVIGRQGQVVGSMPWNIVFVSNNITDFNLFYRGGGNTFPLYLYPEDTAQQSIDSQSAPVPNLNMDIVDRIAKSISIDKNHFTPTNLLDYIYAVLHSQTYREKYKEFLKIDFPRIPYPASNSMFWDMVQLGSELRKLHLMQSPSLNDLITQYPQSGNNMIINKMSQNSPGYVATNETHGRVWINETQYFDNVPLHVWEFYIGGYQPAQKWLKDRVGRILNFEDILHYQKIIVALSETVHIMSKIDECIEL